MRSTLDLPNLQSHPISTPLTFNNSWMRLYHREADQPLVPIKTIAPAESTERPNGLIRVETGEGSYVDLLPNTEAIDLPNINVRLFQIDDNKPFMPLFLDADGLYFQVSHIIKAGINLLPIMRHREDVALLATDNLGNQYLANTAPIGHG